MWPGLPDFSYYQKLQTLSADDFPLGVQWSSGGPADCELIETEQMIQSGGLSLSETCMA
jgi:hypothetical protein